MSATEPICLSVGEGGVPAVFPEGAAPRLARAFERGAGFGLLDLVKFDLPSDAAAVLHWLKEKARAMLVRSLRVRGGGGFRLVVPDGAEAARWLAEMPPCRGGGHLSAGGLRQWFEELDSALAERAAQGGMSPEGWLAGLGDGWEQVGRLCFHLAENGHDADGSHPFAFLATLVHQVSKDHQAKHVPLGMALKLYEEDRDAMLALLRPLRDAAVASPFLRDLVDSQSVFRPQVWSARQAYDFLQSVSLLEQAGIDVRMVNLWKSLPPKVEVEVRMEGEAAEHRSPSLNIHSLLRFSPAVVLGEHRLSAAELEELLSGDDGLVRFRGEWVRVDGEKVAQILEQWRNASRMASVSGVPLLTGLRLLLGGRSKALPWLPEPDGEVRLEAGDVLEQALEALGRGGCVEVPLPDGLDAVLRGYQKEGVRFLAGVTEAGFGACLADDMGLGKTLQVIAWLSSLRLRGVLDGTAALIVAPASLLGNWQDELRRFAPDLDVAVLHPDYLEEKDVVHLRENPAWLLRRGHVALTTYGMVARLEALGPVELPAVVLDEAQAVKNADSLRSLAVRRLNAVRRVALTGTPVENSMQELWSLFDFLTPGLLGSSREFAAMLRESGSRYDGVRRLVRPFMLRRLKSDAGIAPELPSKTETPCFCLLTPDQARLYKRQVEELQAVIHEPDPAVRLALVLPYLSRLKQICNHPAQYLGTGYMNPEESGKMVRLRYLAREVAEAGDCMLVFTQYRSMIEPLHDLLESVFGRPGLALHGGTPLERRKALVDRFQSPGGPPFFILSLKAAGTGLNLTRASHVVHFDRWWNPAVESQASDRAYRIGQVKPVWVHPFVCRGTIEENIHRMLESKRTMADALLSGGLEKLLMAMSADELLELVKGGSSLTGI